MLSTDRTADALAFLKRALGWFGAQGISVRAVMNDNVPARLGRLAWTPGAAQAASSSYAPLHSALLVEGLGYGKATRHTTATLLLTMGIRLEVIQETRGHATFRRTRDLDTEVLPEIQTDAADKMDAFLSGGS